ncbi:MAG: SIMPL domain-containing protein [Telluria sp.]
MLKIIVLAAALGSSSFAAAQGLPAYPFVHASGSGSIMAAPDIGELDFELTAGDTDPAAALAVLETRIAQIRTLAHGLGIPAHDLEIRDPRKDIRKGTENEAAPVYDLRAGVHIKVADLSKWRELVSPLAGMPNLDGFATAFDTSQRDKVEVELMEQAMATARRKAQTMAKGAGQKLGAVTAVTSGELKNLTRAMGLSPSEGRYSGAGVRRAYNQQDLLAIEIIKLSQSVDMIFRLK